MNTRYSTTWVLLKNVCDRRKQKVSDSGGVVAVGIVRERVVMMPLCLELCGFIGGFSIKMLDRV